MNTLPFVFARPRALGVALTCALLIPACGSGSPGQSSMGSGGAGGATGGGTGGNSAGDAAVDNVVADDTGTTPAVDAAADAGDQLDVAADAPGNTVADAGADANGGGALNAAVVEMMRKVADWQLPKAGGSKDWIHGTLWTGVMATYQTTKDEKYLTAIKSWGAPNWDIINGGLRADNQCAAQTYFETYLLDPTPANMVMVTGSKASFDALLTVNAGRAEWSWEDALFMSPPGMVRLAAALKDNKYIDKMNALYWDTYQYLWNPQAGLMYRDNGLRGNFWARGNGWVIAGAARILQYLPANDPKRPDFVKLIQDMAAALKKCQGSDGLWRADLLNPDRIPNPETSGTGFFTYGIAWGINAGILDKATYFSVAKSGWDGLVSHVDATGKLGYVQPMGVGPAAAGANSTVEYGVGAFLLAGSEMAKLLP